MHTYSEERNCDDDAPVLGARQLVDGVADVAVVLLGGAAEAGAGGDSFGGHCCMFVCVCVCVCVCWLEMGDGGDDVVCGCGWMLRWDWKVAGSARESCSVGGFGLGLWRRRSAFAQC